MTGSTSSSLRLGRCRQVIRWKICCARPRIFGQKAALADALLHPQDRAYSVPQLFDFIATRRADFRPLGKAGALLPSLWRDGADPPGLPDGAAFPGRTICSRGAFSRHDGSPQHDCLPRREIATGTSRSVSTATPGWDTCPFGCQRRSAFRSACPLAPRRSDKSNSHLHGPVSNHNRDRKKHGSMR